MSDYKNSAGVKFNDATDLIIRADPDGTVESVYNRADQTEYIGYYSKPTPVTITFTNNSSSARTISYVSIIGDYLRATSITISQGATTSFTTIKYGYLVLGASYKFDNVTGDCLVTDNTMVPYEDVSADIINA